MPTPQAAPHQHDLSPLHHSHEFGEDDPARLATRRRAVLQVTVVTLLAMFVEIAVGWWSGSLALLADGAHMGTHALALGGAALAYHLSARASRSRVSLGYAFGGWKIEVLAAYTSALLLLATALWLVWEALQALRAPHAVAWNEALVVAVLGLVVNLVCAYLLARAQRTPEAAGAAAAGGGHGHHHGHAHAHPHGHGHGHGHAKGHAHDANFSAAYLHVLADALTSVLAIAALAAGAWWGVRWLDPAVALLGAVVIGRWSLRLIGDTAAALVDATADPKLAQQVRQHIQTDGDAHVADLHVWQVGGNAWSVALSVVADAPLSPEVYHQRLQALSWLRHATIEVHRCRGQGQPAA